MPMDSVRVELPPAAAFSTHYRVTATGQFDPLGDVASDRCPVSFHAAATEVTFTAATARTTAAFLLALLYQHADATPGTPVADAVSVTPAPPTSRTRLVSHWDLGSGGVRLRFHARTPYRLVLDVPAPGTTRALTIVMASYLAEALLAGAREVEHAQAVADHAVHADRASQSVTESLRKWLTSIQHELPRDGDGLDILVDRLRDVLADEDSCAEAERRQLALGRAHGDLRAQLDQAWWCSTDTIGHAEVSYLLRELAARHAVPMVSITASSLELREVLPETVELTEGQWARVARSPEMTGLPGRASALIRQHHLVDLAVALRQAGVLCRGHRGTCGRLVPGEIADSWGYCPACRPQDLPTAVAAGCCADGTWQADHDLPNSRGACRTCLLPLSA